MISFDATRSALELVQQGIITADIECNPDQGIYVDELIRKMRNGKPAPKLTFVPETVYTKRKCDRGAGKPRLLMENRGIRMLKVFLVEDESVIREGFQDKIPWGQYGFELVGKPGTARWPCP